VVNTLRITEGEAPTTSGTGGCSGRKVVPNGLTPNTRSQTDCMGVAGVCEKEGAVTHLGVRDGTPLVVKEGEQAPSRNAMSPEAMMNHHRKGV
jgi:hypothetical protein